MKSGRERFERLLEHDKEEMNEESRAAALREFMRVAGEYFEPDGGGTLTLERDKGGFSAAFRFHASRVKNFKGFYTKTWNDD